MSARSVGSAGEDTGDDTGDDGERDGSGDRELEPLRFLLPDESDPGAGFTRVTAECADTEGYGAYVTFAHPEGWDPSGRGSGGGGSVLGTSVDLRFTTENGEVEVEMEADSRRPDGPPLNSDGEPFESFDYESTRGDDTVTISYEPVGTVTVGEQEAEIVVADQAQAPDFLSRTEHKVRLELAELPNPAPGDGEVSTIEDMRNP